MQGVEVVIRRMKEGEGNDTADTSGSVPSGPAAAAAAAASPAVCLYLIIHTRLKAMADYPLLTFFSTISI